MGCSSNSARHRLRKSGIGVRVSGGPLSTRAHGPRGRRRDGMPAMRVRFPRGPLHREVAGSRLAGPLWKGGSPIRRGGFDSLTFRCCPDGETDIMPRFERGVAGSIPARGASFVPSFSGQDVPSTWGRPVVRVHPGRLIYLDSGLSPLPDQVSGFREATGRRVPFTRRQDRAGAMAACPSKGLRGVRVSQQWLGITAPPAHRSSTGRCP